VNFKGKWYGGEGSEDKRGSYFKYGILGGKRSIEISVVFGIQFHALKFRIEI